MNDVDLTQFEARFEQRLRRYAAVEVRPIDADAVARLSIRTRPSRLSWLMLPRLAIAPTYALILIGLLIALLLTFVAIGAWQRITPRPPLGRNGSIAYSVRYQNGSEVNLLNADGGAQRDLGTGSCPLFSADGQSLAYFVDTDNSNGVSPEKLRVAAGDGSTSVDLGTFLPRSYAIAPDGTAVVLVQPSPDSTDRGRRIMVVPVASGSARVLVPEPADADLAYDEVSWSPDGRSIAYSIVREVRLANGISARYRTAVDVVDVETGVTHQLTPRPGPAPYAGLSWSPDSTAVAYVGYPDGSSIPTNGASATGTLPAALFVVGVDGSGDHEVARTSSGVSEPRWSPDGTEIALETYFGETTLLAVVALDGMQASGPPTVGPAADVSTWSPDSTLILYEVFDSATQGGTLATIDAHLREQPRVVLSEPLPVGCPSWQRILP